MSVQFEPEPKAFRRPKMIATDLDGTLLRRDGTISDRTRSVLVNAVAAGIEVVPATGRPLMMVRELMEDLDFVHHWVLANGALVWHNGRSEIVKAFWLEPELARRLIVQIRDQVPNVGFALEFRDRAVFEKGFERVVPQSVDQAPSFDIIDELDAPVLKILVFDMTIQHWNQGRSAAEIEAFWAKVQAAVGGEALAHHSGLSFIEVAGGHVTKATALEVVAAELGVVSSEVVAFGDYHNDIAMLEWAGRSYAPRHASADALAAADQVIGSNDDDSVAEVIESLLAER